MSAFWPESAPERASRFALVVIDMQVDFCASGGWVDQLGEDIGKGAFRWDGSFHTREGTCRI